MRNCSYLSPIDSTKPNSFLFLRNFDVYFNMELVLFLLLVKRHNACKFEEVIDEV